MSGSNACFADAKREECRKYLEKNGVMDVLTKILASLYDVQEKPADPLKYLTECLTKAQKDQPTIDALKSELTELKLENSHLKQENELLKDKIANGHTKEPAGC